MIPERSANGIGPHYIQEKGIVNRITKDIINDIKKK